VGASLARYCPPCGREPESGCRGRKIELKLLVRRLSHQRRPPRERDRLRTDDDALARESDWSGLIANQSPLAKVRWLHRESAKRNGLCNAGAMACDFRTSTITARRQIGSDAAHLPGASPGPSKPDEPSFGQFRLVSPTVDRDGRWSAVGMKPVSRNFSMRAGGAHCSGSGNPRRLASRMNAPKSGSPAGPVPIR